MRGFWESHGLRSLFSFFGAAAGSLVRGAAADPVVMQRDGLMAAGPRQVAATWRRVDRC